MKQYKIFGTILLFGFLVVLYSCRKLPYGTPNDNLPPTIELTNNTEISDSTLLTLIDSLIAQFCIDSIGDTTFSCVDSFFNEFFSQPRLIQWEGEDIDGGVVGFWYTYNDTTHNYSEKYRITIIGDDTIKEPVAVSETLWNWEEDYSLIVKLPASDTLETVVFYVISEDDQGALSLQGKTKRLASVVLFRKNNEVPVVSFDSTGSPDDGEMLFVLEDTTLTWKGIPFKFIATETEEQTVPYEFSYVWDPDPTWNWSEWSEEDEVVFTENNTPAFAQDGLHTLYVRSRDDALAIGWNASRSIFTVTPTMDKGVLVVDATRNLTGTPGLPDDEQVDEFYRLILEKAGISFDTLDRSDESPPLTPQDLASYSTIIYHTDDRNIPVAQEVLADYLDVGGNHWIGGHKIFSQMNAVISLETYFGIDTLDLQAAADFIGAKPMSGFPRLDIDTSKIFPTDEGKLVNVEIAIVTNFINFGRLYLFDSATDDPRFECSSGCIVGFLFQRPSTADPVSGDVLTYSKTAGFTFPLYPIKVDSLTGEPLATVAREILKFFGEL